MDNLDDSLAENSPENSRNPADHLKEHRWQKGQSGNPGGRPKKSWLTELTEEMLDEKSADAEQRKRWKDAQWEKMIKSGVVGAMFMEKAWERTEGKVAQPVRVSGELTVSLADEIRKARERAEEE